MFEKKIVLNTFFLALARFIGLLFSFFVILFVGRFFGAAALGQYNLGFSVAAFFTVIADAGIATIIVRELAKKKTSKGFFPQATGAKLLLAFFSVLLAFFVSFFFFSGSMAFLVFAFCLGIIVDSFSLVFRSVFKARQEMHLEAWVFVLQKIVFAFIAAVFFFFGFGFFSIALAFLLSNIVSFVFSVFLFLRFKYRERLFFVFPGKQIFAVVVLPFLFIGLLDILAGRLDVFLVKFLLNNDTALGLYSMPKAIFDALLIVQLSFSAALFPELSRLFEEDKKKLSSIVSRAAMFLLFFSLPVVVVSFVFSKQIVVLLFGLQFLSSAPVFFICSVSLFFLGFQSLFFNLLFVFGKQKTVALIFALMIISNAIISFYLVPLFSIIGAAIASLFAIAFSVLLSFFSLRKYNVFGSLFLVE